MKRTSKILAIIMALSILLGLLVTSVFASDAAYSDPTLLPSGAVKIKQETFTGNEGTLYGGYSERQIYFARWQNSATPVRSSLIDGVKNEFLVVTTPEDEENAFMINGAQKASNRTSYLQFTSTGTPASPNLYLGVYDSNLADDVTPSLTNNFDYLTYDFDISSQGARVDWTDGTYSRASALTKNDDGSIAVTLIDGTLVTTNASKTVTTIISGDNKTVWENNGNVIKSSVYVSDALVEESVTTVNTDGSATKLVTTYDEGGNVKNSYGLTRSATVDGAYTVTYESGKTVTYFYSETSASVVVDEANGTKKTEITTTEIATIVDGDTTTEYKRVDRHITRYWQYITETKTVNGEIVGTNTTTFDYNKTGKVTTGYAAFDEELSAAIADFSDADVLGLHIADAGAVYITASMYNTLRYYNIVTNSTTGAKSYNLGTSKYTYLQIKEVNGSWGLFATSGTCKESNRIATLPDEIGVWTHISVVLEADNTNWYNSKCHFIVNGELLHTYTLSSSDVSGISKNYAYVASEDWRISISDVMPSGYQNYYALGIDNLAINAYQPTIDENGNRVAYSSGDSVYGIDDFFHGDKTGSYMDVENVVYNSSYPAMNPQYYIKSEDETVYLPALYKEFLEGLSEGALVNSTVSVYDVNPGAPFTFVTTNGSELTITEEAKEKFLLLKTEADGVTTYLVKYPSSDEKITLNWVDTNGKTIATEILLPDAEVNTSDKFGSIYNPETGKVNVVSGWYWDLDGDGPLYSESKVGQITLEDTMKIGGSTVTVYPKYSEADVSGAAYWAYVETINGDLAIYESASNLASLSNLQTTINNSPENAIIKLAYVDDGILIKQASGSTYTVGAGKKLTVDINGNTITQSYTGTAWGAGIFLVSEGAEFTVTSSAENARIYIVCKRSKTTDTSIYGTGGVVCVAGGVDRAVVNMSNFEFNGGTIFIANGEQYLEAPAISNDVSIDVTVTNVTAYAALRSSYALFANKAPDVNLTIIGCNIYNDNTTYAIFHDYSDVVAEDKANAGATYYSETDIVVKDSTFHCMTTGGSYTKLWYSIKSDSSFYVENSTIIAKNVLASNALTTFGDNVVISTDSTTFKAKLASGVSYLVNKNKTDKKLTLTFNKSGFSKNPANFNESTGVLTDVCYDRSAYADVTSSALITFVTYTPKTKSEYVGHYAWMDNNGSSVSDGYALVGSTLTPPKSADEVVGGQVSSNYFTTSYQWVGANDDSFKVVSGENIFNPVGSYVASISGKKANMTLTTGMIFNVYLPAPDELVVEDSITAPDSIGSAETVTVDGYDMIRLSFAYELWDFEAQSVNINFTTSDGKALTYELKIDAIAYVTLVAEKYLCGSEEAQLAYEIIAYKEAVALYIAEAEGKTLSDVLTAEELEAISAFKSVFTAHGDGCVCADGLYNEDEVNAGGGMDDAYTAAGITSFAYLLKAVDNGLRIDVMEGTAVTSVSYKNLLGVTVVHDAALENLKLIETDSGSYYVVSGISASDITAEFTINVLVSGEPMTVEYSLAKNIVSTDADIAKALYSYSKAAWAYKAITKSEKN